MDYPDAKALKKLADACRKAGIKSFKGNGIEFVLSDEAPVSNYKRTTKKAASTTTDNTPDAPYESADLSESELLFWSVGDVGQSSSTEGDPQ